MVELLKKFNGEMLHRVLYEQDCDIDYDFVGFIETYKRLSQVIPRHWIIVDLGCAYAPQCWYFRKHAKYIGIDHSVKYRFSVNNTEHHIQSIQDWIKYHASAMPENTFAIANYSLIDTTIVRESFNYCFTYYPVRRP